MSMSMSMSMERKELLASDARGSLVDPDSSLKKSP